MTTLLLRPLDPEQKTIPAGYERVELVGLAGVAEILKVPKPHVYRLRDSGELPEKLENLDSGPVWAKADIRKLRDRRRRRKRGRAP